MTREFREGRTGSRFSFNKRACVEVLHDCKQHGKKFAWVFCKSDLRYPKRQAAGVRFFSFPRRRRKRGNCFRMNKACAWSAAGTAEHKQGRLQLSSLRLHNGQCFDQFLLLLFFLNFFFFSVCIWWVLVLRWLCDNAWCTHDCTRSTVKSSCRVTPRFSTDSCTRTKNKQTNKQTKTLNSCWGAWTSFTLRAYWPPCWKCLLSVDV